MAESQLLFHYEFRIPASLNFQSLKEAEEAIATLEGQLMAASFLTFQ
jgi:hypothetical protein